VILHNDFFIATDAEVSSRIRASGFREKYTAADFPEENGRLRHTLQHTLELVWHPVCEKNGYKVAVV